MKILALDSSGIVASVAVVEDDTLLAEYTVNYRTPYRLGNSQRPGTCPEETIGSSTDSRCTGI